MARYVVGLIILWPLVALGAVIVATLVVATRLQHPWAGVFAVVPIAFFGYAWGGRWVGNYGIGLATVAHAHGSECALKVVLFRPSLIPTGDELECATGDPARLAGDYCR